MVSMQIRYISLSLSLTHSDGVVGSGDEGDEERQHHVDEERDEGVEIDLTKKPHQCPAALHLGERGKHVVSVYQREQTLRHGGERAELRGRWEKEIVEIL